MFKTLLTKHFKKQKSTQSGFTVIELMIVIVIMAVMTMVILFDNRSLNSNVLVSNTAYEVQLIIREMQAYGIGARSAGDTVGDFNYSQGAHFDITYPKQIILFTDKNSDGLYSAGEQFQTFSIDNERAGQILNVCTPDGVTCTSGGAVDILFKRPNPEAVFSGSFANSAAVAIIMGFATSPCRSVIIHRAGSVEMGSKYCPGV